jgi:ferredoxin
MAAAMRGDIARVADLSFDCIMCGMCVSRCPAEEAQPNIAILCRRLYGKYLAPKAQHLAERVAEIEAGTYDDEFARIKALPEADLRQIYNTRDIEPE